MKNITIVGCGSLGGNVAIRLHANGFNLKVIDDDIVEEKNLNYGVFTKEDVGKPKVVALKEKLNNINILSLPYKFEDCVDLIEPNDIILNCADSNLLTNKGNIIKCCISDKFLLMDTRKNKNKNILIHGVYHEDITISDVEICSDFISQFLCHDEYLYKFLLSDTYVILNIEDLHNVKIKELTQQQEIKKNCIHKKNKIFDYIMQLAGLVNSIIDNPYKKDLTIVFSYGNKNVSFILEKEKQNNFNEVVDIMSQIFFNSFNEQLIEGSDFLISNKINNTYTIIPAVGGA